MEVSIAEAAKLLRVSEHTVRRRLRNGELPGSQVAIAGGFVWMVELPDDVATDSPPSGEMARVDALIASLEARIASQELELEVKNRQIGELHVLLQQAALPQPTPRRSWWKWW